MKRNGEEEEGEKKRSKGDVQGRKHLKKDEAKKGRRKTKSEGKS